MKFSSVALVAALLAAPYAYAQAPAPSPEMKAALQAVQKACHGEVQQLCPGKKGEEAAACLKSNGDKLNPNCKDALSKVPKPAS